MGTLSCLSLYSILYLVLIVSGYLYLYFPLVGKLFEGREDRTLLTAGCTVPSFTLDTWVLDTSSIK